MGEAQIGLQRRLALVTPPLPGESLYSWLDAMAADYGITRQRAAVITGVGPSHGPVRLDALVSASPIYGAPPAETDRITAATGLSREAFLNMTWHRFTGTALLAEAVLRVTPSDYTQFRTVLLDHGVTPENLRVCPACFRENDGRWPLAWCLPWSFLCPRHRCYMVDHCPRCKLPLRSSAKHGVCGRWRVGAGAERPCYTPLSEMVPVACEDQQLINLQELLLDRLHAHGDERAQARADFADLWAMSTVAMFLMKPRHLAGADPAVQHAFGGFRERLSRGYLRPTAQKIRTPSPLVFAALVRVASEIAFADNPLLAMSRLFGGAWYQLPDRLTGLWRAWGTAPLKLAPVYATERVREVLVTARAPHTRPPKPPAPARRPAR